MRRHYPAVPSINQANYESGVPGHSTNCGPSTLATDYAIRTGHAIPAPPSNPVYTTQMEQVFGSSYQNANSYNAVTQHFAAQPPGTRGSLFVNHSNSGVGHFFNVHHDSRGAINYIDGQSGLPANLSTNPNLIWYMQHP